jgi:hypothetical protein
MSSKRSILDVSLTEDIVSSNENNDRELKRQKLEIDKSISEEKEMLKFLISKCEGDKEYYSNIDEAEKHYYNIKFKDYNQIFLFLKPTKEHHLYMEPSSSFFNTDSELIHFVQYKNNKWLSDGQLPIHHRFIPSVALLRGICSKVSLCSLKDTIRRIYLCLYFRPWEMTEKQKEEIVDNLLLFMKLHPHIKPEWWKTNLIDDYIFSKYKIHFKHIQYIRDNIKIKEYLYKNNQDDIEMV